MISVITTFHNQKQFVDECIGGFINQHIDTPEYEIIAVCDSCTDGTEDYIRENYPDVKVYSVAFKNAPMSRNYGFDRSVGDFILYFDGDDIPYENMLVSMYNAFEHGIDFVYSRFEHPDFGLDKQKLGLSVLEFDAEFGKVYPQCNGIIMTRRDIDPMWDPYLTCCQDADRWYALVYGGKKGKHVRQVLWNYRVHDGSMWVNGEAKKDVKAMCEYIDNKYGVEQYRPKRIETTLVSLISRDTVLMEYMDSINKLDIDRSTFSWFIYIDTTSEDLVDKVKILSSQIKGWGLKRIFVTWAHNKTEATDFVGRGMHIANHLTTIFHSVSTIYPTKYLFMIEDDTLVPPNAYQLLLRHLIDDDMCAVATGIEMSRSVSKHLGICHLVEDEGEIVGRRTIKDQKAGWIDVDGCGWYCWVGRVNAIKDAEMKCEGHPKNLGPDTLSMYSLRKKGWNIIADFDVPCKHWDPVKEEWLTPDQAVGLSISFYKDNQGIWNHDTKIF